jgi:hypothetical protein
MTRRHSIDEQADNTPWVKALAKVLLMAAREGYCYQHVQVIAGHRPVRGEGAGQSRVLPQQTPQY